MNTGLNSIDFLLDSSSTSDSDLKTDMNTSARDKFIGLYLEQLPRDDAKSGVGSTSTAFRLNAEPQPEVDGNKNAGKDGPATPPAAIELSKIPHSDLVVRILGRSIGAANELLKVENERKRATGQPVENSFDEEKLKEEWQRGEFGPESKRLWAKAHKLIEQDVKALTFELESRAIAFPPGSPIQPEKSASGSGLPETDESFRARIRNGDFKFSFSPKEFNKDGIPSAEDVTRFANHYVWTQYAKHKCVMGALDSQAASVEFHLKGLDRVCTSRNLDGWKRPPDLTPEQSERWANATMDWINTVQRVRTYADTMAAFNAATTDKGFQFPGLSDLFKRIKLPENATVFPDEAIKSPNFPGKITRGPDGLITEMKLDLPETSERTPENLRKMQKLENWLRTYGPQVDKIWGQMLDTDQNPDRTLMWLVDGDFTREKGSTHEDLRELNPHLKGDNTDINSKVVLPGDELDWFVKSIENGQYLLEKRAPNGEPFNLKRSGFTAEACDKNGNPDSKGDYVSVTSFRKYEWARSYAYNNWNYFGSIESLVQVNEKPQVFHRNDFVLIIEDGRLRILQAKHLQGWADAQENARRTGNVVGTAVDVGMCVTGTIEYRAAWIMAKKMGSAAAKQVTKEALKGTWHIGLGTTGFARQAILNNFDWGQDFMNIRHKALMIDMAIQVAPGKVQARFWEQLPVLGSAKGKSAMEVYSEWALTKDARFIDKLLTRGQKVFTGWEVKKDSKYLPHVGVFFLADSYYLAEATDMVSDWLKKDHKEPLIAAAIAHRSMKDGPKPSLYGPESEERLKKATAGVLNEYATKFGGRSAELLSDAANKLFLPPNSPERIKLQDAATKMFLNSIDERERVPAAILLLALNENQSADETLIEKSGVKYTVGDILNYVRKQSDQSSNIDVRLVAGDTLFRLDRCNSAKLNALEEAFKTIQSEQNAKPEDAQLKQRLEETKAAYDKATRFRKSINYNSADYTTLLMDVLKSDKATREQKLSTIASPNGVRLAMLLEHRRYNSTQPLDGMSKVETDALLYGRDADYIHKGLLDAVRDSNNHQDVRAVAAYALRATVGNDRAEPMLKLNGLVALASGEQGQLQKRISNELLRELQVDLKTGKTPKEREKLLQDSFLAAKTIKDCGPENLFADASKIRQTVAEAFAKQITSSSPVVARLAITELTPALLKSLPLEKQDELREYVLNPMRAPRSNSERDDLRLCLIQKAPELFADATPQQKSLATLYLESMLIPGAATDFAKQNPRASFPSFESNFPEARVQAIYALSRFDANRAVELAQLLLQGGAYGQQDIPKDNAHVRLAAVNVLERVKPFDWQKIAISSLRSETDPAILQRLWNMEFAARTNIDPVRLEKQMDGLRERVDKRSGNGWTRDAFDRFKINEDKIGRYCEEPGCAVCLGYNRGASLGLLTIASEEPKGGDLKEQLKAVDTLFKVSDRIPSEIAQLTGPIENTLLSNPSMHPAVREKLLNLYIKVGLGKNGLVSKDEAALVLSRMLGNSIRDLQSDKGCSSSFVKANQQLTQTILDNLKSFKSTASIPTLLALTSLEKDPFQTIQAAALEQSKTAALEQLRELVGTTHLADEAATDEVNYAQRGGTNGAILGGAKTTSALADLMADALADSSLDAFQVVVTLGAATKVKPFEGTQDPRLKTLQIALRDKNDVVKMAAAKLCLETDARGAREGAIFALADVSKNGAMQASKTQAMDLLKAAAASTPELVQRALAETATRATSPSERSPVAIDVRMQRHFENLRRQFSGKEFGAGWLEKDFDHFARKNHCNMLSPELREGMIDKDIQKIWEAHSGAFKSDKIRLEAVKTALNAQVQKVSTEFGSVIDTVLNPSADTQQRKDAIQALIYVINNDGAVLRLSQDNKWARHAVHRPDCTNQCIDKAIDAIVAVSSGKGLAAGEMEPVLRQLLIENTSLTRTNKAKLVAGLDALASNGGLSRENTVSILTLAFETEMRFGPRATQFDHHGSLQYQKALLDQMVNHGNAELIPILDYFSSKHHNKEIKEAATKIRDSLKSSTSDIVKRAVDGMLADTRGENGFPGIVDVHDARIPLLRAAANDNNLPVEKRFRAAEILLTASNRAISQDLRKEAANAFARWGTRYPHPDESIRLRAIAVVLDNNNVLYSESDRKSAALALARLSIGGGEQIRERAMFHLTKLENVESRTAVDQVLRSALLYADHPDKRATIESALERVFRMHEQALKQNEPGLFGKEQIRVLSQLVLRGNNTAAQQLLGKLSSQLGVEVLRTAADTAQDYLTDIKTENARRAKNLEALKELAKQRNWSEKLEKEMAAKHAPISPDPVVLKRFADLVTSLEKDLVQSRESDAELFKAFSFVRHLDGAEISALRVRVDKAIERLKAGPPADNSDPRKPWLDWYEKETYKEPTDTEQLSKYSKALRETSNDKARMDILSDVLVLAASSSDKSVRQNALEILKATKGEERQLLKLMVTQLAKEDPKRRYTEAQRAVVRELEAAVK